MSKIVNNRIPKTNCRCAVIVGLVTLALSVLASYLTYDYNRKADQEAAFLAEARKANCGEIADCLGYDAHEAIAVTDVERFDVQGINRHTHMTGCLVKTNLAYSDPYSYFKEFADDKNMEELSNVICSASTLIGIHQERIAEEAKKNK